jgi:ribonuclease HI
LFKPKTRAQEKTNIPKHLMVFSDGGARGNPGPAAIAFIIQSETGKTLTKDAYYVGVCTNNQAEYKALLAALESAAAYNAETVTCHSDSELVVKQVIGEYRVKNEELREQWRKVQEAKKRFREVKFVNVPRSHTTIQEADRLVNQALDARTE